MAPRSYLDLPDGWERVDTRSAGPFVTSETLRKPDGSVVVFTSAALCQFSEA